MDLESDELVSLEGRHRKEKKELQAQIQALKKTAKNDKTKKKELAAEITRLESDLDIRHQQELEEFEKEPIAISKDINVDCGLSKLKISKAQKRRDKKTQQEKEREDQIKLQEKENINGPRNVEIQSISARLKKKKLKMFLIPSDGDCLYRAVAHQLEISRHKIMTIDELRKSVAEYIMQHKNDFLPFMSNPESFEMLCDEEFNEYCKKILDTKVWGGQLEIQALSKILKCPISVVQATGPESIEQGAEFAGSPLIITYHRHMYSLGEHYNSTCAIENVNNNI